ncbi:MAG: hypothetical protein V4473_01640 [Patescibacteria group bacterium]
MKEKLIKLLRELENRSGFENKYFDYDPTYQSNYSIVEYIDFPNYLTVIENFNIMYKVISEAGLIIVHPSNAIRAELKRMESEGLIMIGTQNGLKSGTTTDSHAPDFDEPIKFTCESIILTTKGKSTWQYLIYKATEENPLATVLSLVAIIVSVFALFF